MSSIPPALSTQCLHRPTDPGPTFVPALAAAALGALLDRRDIPSAVAGGIACAFYASARFTYDLDVVVGVPGTSVRALKTDLGTEDGLRSVGNALYFDPPQGGTASEASHKEPLPIKFLPLMRSPGPTLSLRDLK